MKTNKRTTLMSRFQRDGRERKKVKEREREKEKEKKRERREIVTQ